MFKNASLLILGLFLTVIIVFFIKSDIAPKAIKNDKNAQKLCQINCEMLSSVVATRLPLNVLAEGGYINPKYLQCPSEKEGHISYAYNKYFLERDNYETYPKSVVLFEADSVKNGLGGPEDIVFRHERNGLKGCYILFTDGRVEFITEDKADALNWGLSENNVFH